MPNNKKHHYVPRFYLKRFSTNGKSINIWNISKEKCISYGNLKNQCYKDYFYGKELEIEKALGKIEGEAAAIFNLIDQYQFPPPNNSQGYITLILYILIQYGRTTYSADSLDEMTDKLMKHLLKEQAEAEGIEIDRVRIGVENPASYSLGMILLSHPLMLDLGCKVLINKTSVDFVTSDNPVVLYNQLFSFQKHGSNTGLFSKGLQMFLPINSKTILVFYDSQSYSMGSGYSPSVEVRLPRDVYQLNILQMTSAYQNVYFENSELDVKTLFRKAKPFRRTRKSNIEIFPTEETGDIRKELIASSREDVLM